MKKTFKRTIACLLAMLMVISSLPFTVFAADAGDSSTTSTSIGVKSYGLFTNEGGQRWGGTYANIINDNGEDKFDIGFVNFDISNFTATQFDDISKVYYTIYIDKNQAKNIPLYVMYPTQNQSCFDVDTNVVWGTKGNAKKIEQSVYNSIWKKPTVSGNRSESARQYFGLKAIESITTSKKGETREVTVDIADAIKAAKAAHRSTATIVFMLANGNTTSGFSDTYTGTGDWSDTYVYYFGKNGTPESTKLNVVVVTSLAADKQYIASMIDKGAPTYSYAANESGNSLANHNDYMKNVLVSGAWSQTTKKIDDFAIEANNPSEFYFNYKANGMKNVVAIYDSENADIRIPVTFETGTPADTQTGCYEYIGFDHVALTNSGAFSLGEQYNNSPMWVRSASWIDFSNANDSKYNFSSDINVDITGRKDDDYQDTRYEVEKIFKQWKNYIKFSPDDNFSTQYYSTLNNVQYTIQADITCSWKPSIFSSFKYYPTNNYTTVMDIPVSYSVINYLPLKNLLNDEELKSNYKFISTHEDMYEQESLVNYYTSLAALYKFNLKDGLTADTVVDKANEMKTLIANYKLPTKKTYKITFIKNDTSREEKTVTAGDAIGTLPKNSTPIHSVNTDQHYVYSWDGVTAETVPTADAEYSEKSALAKCTYTYEYKDKTNHTKKCTACDYVVDEAHTLNENGLCTLCNQQIIDYTAYNDTKKTADSALTNKAEYEASTFNNFKAVYDEVTVKAPNAKTQAELDSYTSQLLSALSMLRKKMITIKIKICKNDQNTINQPDETVEYGTPLDINSGIDPTKESVKGWVVRTKTADGKETATKVGTIDSKFTLHATKDATVEAYVVSRTDETTTAYSKVIFYGFNGRVIDVKYLADGVTLEEKDYNISAPTVPFYSFTSWSTNSVTGNGKDIIVRANYSADPTAQQCNVHYERFENGSKQYSYDQYVYLPDVQNGEYFALSTSEEATEDTILTYLNGREFHVPMVSDIYVVKVNAADRKAKVAVTGNYATTPVADKNRAVFNCKFYLPEGCEAVEWGARITANNRTKAVKSDKESKYNEYSIYMDVPKTSSIKGFTAVAYVTYRDSTGTYTTIESQPVTQAFN
ncbi:hypothetical protein [uncultured Eubacterium sp.]|uniref:hypothetical protein n=1 Tax=uncultured Eubacterium sp. TaxID=165185 RepID=UPI0025DEAED8|nr:hypothetical protein [uncultured Eubacterium sp.]